VLSPCSPDAPPGPPPLGCTPSTTMSESHLPPLKVTHFQRKLAPDGSPSIEVLFETIRRHLDSSIVCRVSIASVLGRGLFRRLLICAQAMLRQGDINHITGDINYLGIVLRGRRTILTIHDCYFLTTTTGLRRAILRFFWLVLPVRRCAVITAVSESTRREVGRFLPLHQASLIRVIPNAISKRYTRSDRPFERSRPRILQVGTGPNKNLPRLIEALHAIPCHLDIVGRPDREIELLLGEHGIEHSWRTRLTDQEMVNAYRLADIVSFVSTYEGFGMPIAEAQATGRPVIASNISPLSEVAGDAAVLVDPHDVASIRAGILRIIQDDDLREGLVQRGFRNAARFHPAEVSRAYADLYREVAARQLVSERGKRLEEGAK
jgi:glycosyltransferase involved in cell wall biosynthesis